MKTHQCDDIERQEGEPALAEHVGQRVEGELLEMSLADLRRGLGITQVKLAGAADMALSQISALENGDDHLLSTLRRSVRALGGELEVIAVVGDRRIKLAV
jgi:DNA-binding XRE family transcriptional regulator